MAERRYYRVAGHDFSISADKELFTLLDNYVPFAVPTDNTGGGFHVGPSLSPLFDLVILPADISPITTDGYRLLYTDTSGDDMPRIEVYRKHADSDSLDEEPDGKSWCFLIAERKAAPVSAMLCTTADFNHATLQIMPDSDFRFAIDAAAMLLYAFTASQYGILLMHASAIVQDNQAFLFLGHSGTGKSTHSRLWHQAYPDAWLLNDDNPVVRLMPDGKVLVYGSPWSGKTPCYRQVCVPAKGIVLLKQSPKNKIHPLNLSEAYAAMHCSCSGMKIDPRQADALHNAISRIIQTVPVYGLDCRPDAHAAHLCHDTLKK